MNYMKNWTIKQNTQIQSRCRQKANYFLLRLIKKIMLILKYDLYTREAFQLMHECLFGDMISEDRDRARRK